MLNIKYSEKSIPRFLFLTLLLSIVLYYYPINNWFVRLWLLSSVFINIVLIYKIIWMKRFIIILSLIFGIFISYFTFSWKEPSTETFNEFYINNLKKYIWVRYVRWWENSFWIDCSWLPRKALIDTYIQTWFKTRNILFIKEAFLTWWFDTSARALKDNYRNQTIFLFQSENINDIPEEKLKPWYIAVTADGLHTLSYIWNKQWIEADPIPKKVIIETTPTKNVWFDIPVVILKWNLK